MLKRNIFTSMLVWLFLLFFLILGCGDDKYTDEGCFDRYDACERMVSLCGLTRDHLEGCVNWIEANFPDKQDRIVQMKCMETALDCESMTQDCNLPGS